MPYRSAKQRRFMHAKHPEIAKRWDKKYGGKVVKKKDEAEEEVSEDELVRIESVDVARLWGVQGDAIVFEIATPDEDEDTFLFWLYDAEAYAFIRKMTEVLFEADPSRSGVGSPEALA